MQLLIDSQSSDFSQSINDNKEYSWQKIEIKKQLTLLEVEQNLLGFLLAGYETTSSTLSYCLFVLATQPAELQRLREEIDANFCHDVSLIIYF